MEKTCYFREPKAQITLKANTDELDKLFKSIKELSKPPKVSLSLRDILLNCTTADLIEISAPHTDDDEYTFTLKPTELFRSFVTLWLHTHQREESPDDSTEKHKS
jgi:hypothetical protein